MNSKLMWGILGTGGIARKFATDLPSSATGELAAVASRTPEKAREFAEQFPSRAHENYEALIADPQVDAVYISTPHPMHAAWAIRCAEAGKHILCEKPLTMNVAEAQAVIDAARWHGVFLMEGFLYRSHPQTARLLELIRDGAIGEVRLIHASFSFRAPHGPEHRLFNPELGGGAILDVGCYPVSMVRLLAGAMIGRPFDDPLEVSGCAQIGGTGVDEGAIASLKFGSGLVAQIACGLRVSIENTMRIWGTDGSLIVPNPWHPNRGQNFSKIIIFKEGVPTEIVIREDRRPFAIEADHAAAHLAARQSPMMLWDDTLGNMRTLDRWRESVGLRYEADAG